MKIYDFIKKFNPFYWFWQRRRIKKYAKMIKYFRANPDVFCEEMLGIQLLGYQKTMLKNMKKEE